jgi:rubrerythrin
MKSEKPTNGLASTLVVLDICIELGANAVAVYNEIAEEANQDSSKALLDWLLDIEETRLNRFLVRKQRILDQNPELLENGIYYQRKATGISKMGWSDSWPVLRGPLDVIRYAISCEVRAKQFFRRKATMANDPTQRMMFKAAISDQEYQIRYYDAQREVLIQEQIDYTARSLAKLAV